MCRASFPRGLLSGVGISQREGPEPREGVSSRGCEPNSDTPSGIREKPNGRVGRRMTWTRQKSHSKPIVCFMGLPEPITSPEAVPYRASPKKIHQCKSRKRRSVWFANVVPGPKWEGGIPGLSWQVNKCPNETKPETRIWGQGDGVLSGNVYLREHGLAVRMQLASLLAGVKSRT